MPTHPRRRATIALAALGTVTAGLLVGPTAAAQPEIQACHLFAEPPVLDAGVVYGIGGRAECVSTRRDVTVRLREDRSFWPDRTLGQETEPDALNVTLTAVWDCEGHESATVFTETLTNTGGKTQSARRGITCNEF
jgi:hypothetical protein